MSDALAIANLKALYCRAADMAATDRQAARAMFARVFAPDPLGDYGHGTLHGSGAIVDFLCDAIGGGSAWMIHMIHSPSIVVAGDEAEGEWTVTVHSRRRATGEETVVTGRYADRFRRIADGWRIARIGFARAGAAGAPTLPR